MRIRPELAGNLVLGRPPVARENLQEEMEDSSSECSDGQAEEHVAGGRKTARNRRRGPAPAVHCDIQVTKSTSRSSARWRARTNNANDFLHRQQMALAAATETGASGAAAVAGVFSV